MSSLEHGENTPVWLSPLLRANSVQGSVGDRHAHHHQTTAWRRRRKVCIYPGHLVRGQQIQAECCGGVPGLGIQASVSLQGCRWQTRSREKDRPVKRV